jgi:hypothetical protein
MTNHKLVVARAASLARSRRYLHTRSIESLARHSAV